MQTFIVCRFWASYTDLLDRKPVFVKSMTSLFGFALGDILAQVIGGGSYNLARTLRMTLFGILMDGPVGDSHSNLALIVYLASSLALRPTQDLSIAMLQMNMADKFLRQNLCEMLPLDSSKVPSQWQESTTGHLMVVLLSRAE